LVLERKSEIWINSKFGCKGTTLEFLLEREEALNNRNVFEDEEVRAEFLQEIEEENVKGSFLENSEKYLTKKEEKKGEVDIEEEEEQKLMEDENE
jgi:hypothetical protein